MLYVPSRLSHYGVAQDDCLTFSFGLRYPNLADLLENVSRCFGHQNPDINLTEFYLPLRLTPSLQNSGKLDRTSVQNMKRQLLDALAESPEFDLLFEQAVANTVSARRYELLLGDEVADPDEVRSLLEENFVLQQDNNCKLLYTENPLKIYANGEWLDELNPLEATLLKRLADGETVTFADLEKLAAQAEDAETAMELLLDSICNWLDDGWALLNE